MAATGSLRPWKPYTASPLLTRDARTDGKSQGKSQLPYQARIDQIFQPPLFDDLPEPVMLSRNAELLTLEARIRSFTPLETYWSILRPTSSTGNQDPFALNAHLLYPLESQDGAVIQYKNKKDDGPKSMETCHTNALVSDKESNKSTNTTVPSWDATSIRGSQSAQKSDTGRIVYPLDTAILPSNNLCASTAPTPTTVDTLSNKYRIHDWFATNRAVKEVVNAGMDETVAQIQAGPRADISESQKAAVPIKLFPISTVAGIKKFLETNAFAKQIFEQHLNQKVLELKDSLLKEMEDSHKRTVEKMKDEFRIKLEQTKRQSESALENKIAEIEKEQNIQRDKLNRVVLGDDAIFLSDDEAVRLLSCTPKIAEKYKEMCVDALRRYKEELRDQFQSRLDEIEKESREWIRKNERTVVGDAEVAQTWVEESRTVETPRVESDVAAEVNLMKESAVSGTLTGRESMAIKIVAREKAVTENETDGFRAWLARVRRDTSRLVTAPSAPVTTRISSTAQAAPSSSQRGKVEDREMLAQVAPNRYGDTRIKVERDLPDGFARIPTFKKRKRPLEREVHSLGDSYPPLGSGKIAGENNVSTQSQRKKARRGEANTA